jgi:hypothetical protein
MPITAFSADGNKHIFPDDTDQSVIDTAMKKYAQTMPKQEGVVADVAKEGAKGIGRGLTGFVGEMGEAVMGSFGPSQHAANLMADLGLRERPKPQPGYGEQITKAAGIEASPKTIEGRFAGTTGEFLGNPLTYAGPGGLAAKVLTGIAAALGSEAAGELAAGFGPKAETAARTIGAIAGGKLPSGATRLVTPIPATPERLQAAHVLANEGIVGETAGQITGSKSLQYAESHLGDAPGAGGRATESQNQVSRQFTAAVLRRAGIVNEERATPQVIDGAFRRIGAEMDAIAARNNGRVDTQFFNDLHAAQDEYNATVQQGNRRAVVDNVVDDFTNRLVQTPVLTGDQYQRFRSRLLRLQRSAFGDPEYSQVLGDYTEALDNMMARSIANSQDLQAWQNARRQYRNLIPISRAAAGAGEQVAEGAITPAKLRQVIAGTQRGQREYSRGQGDFAELARSGNILLTPLPNSGTAQRELARFIAASLGAAVGGGLSGGTAAGIGAAAGAIAPGMAGRVLMSPLAQGYLGNQIAPNLPQQIAPPALRSAIPVLTSPLATGVGSGL